MYIPMFVPTEIDVLKITAIAKSMIGRLGAAGFRSKNSTKVLIMHPPIIKQYAIYVAAA